MRSHTWLICLVALSLASCEVSLTNPTPTSATPAFVTATLAATRTPFATPPTPSTSTPAVPAGSGTAPSGCKDGAVLIEDVTIPDGTNLAYGVKFTKTWQFRNSGTCQWSGYTINFVSGDRMGAPDAAPIPETAAKAAVNVSVILEAPGTDGIYTGFFELRNAAGKVLPIGTFKTFWVKITVGNARLPTSPVSTSSAPTSIAPTAAGTMTTQKPPVGCNYTVSGYYPNEMIQLINQARTGAGLPALTVNAQLTSAAQSHSQDMACYSLLSHTGSNASTIGQRIAAAGYVASFYEEMIYAAYGAYPKDAFNWWINDATHHAVIFDTRVTEIGAGFAYVADSAQGNYYTVDVAAP